jgi:hypothetical protein
MVVAMTPSDKIDVRAVAIERSSALKVQQAKVEVLVTERIKQRNAARDAGQPAPLVAALDALLVAERTLGLQLNDTARAFADIAAGKYGDT